MQNDIDWTKEEHCESSQYARRFRQGQLSFLRPGSVQHCRKRTACISCPQRLGKRELKSKRKRVDSSHSYFRQIGSSRTVKTICQRLTRCKETRREWEFGINGDADRISYCSSYFSDWCDESCCVNASNNSPTFPAHHKLNTLCCNSVFRRILTKDNSSLQLMKKDLTMSRERVDSWKHDDLPSPGCEGLLPSRTLRCWDHNRVFISRPNTFLGSHRERNQQIRDRNVRTNTCRKRREQR